MEGRNEWIFLAIWGWKYGFIRQTCIVFHLFEESLNGFCAMLSTRNGTYMMALLINQCHIKNNVCVMFL